MKEEEKEEEENFTEDIGGGEGEKEDLEEFEVNKDAKIYEEEDWEM